MGAIEKAAVIGSGVMGSGIAAQIANAGIPVVLLDIVPADAASGARNSLAEQAKSRMAKTRPPQLMHPDAARLITAGNLKDDIGLIAECDWICEAVVENLAIKRQLYGKLESHRKTGSIMTSNTSTIPIAQLVDGLPERFRTDFAITHFFNPPRHMRLLELVSGRGTDASVVQRLDDFCDRALGKEVVLCKDTPGFIANRIGVFWMAATMSAAFEFGLTVEEADAVAGRPMGVPATGVFGLTDLTGVDLFPMVMRTLSAMLPEADRFQTLCQPGSRLNELITAMLEKGLTGRKGGGGFFRQTKDGNKRTTESLDLASGLYRPARLPDLDSLSVAGKQGLTSLIAHPDKGGQLASYVLTETLTYAASLIPEIADDPATIDIAMKTGYGWKWGLFELLDVVGVDWLRAQIRERGLPMPDFLEVARSRTIYREGSQSREMLTLAGSYRPVRVRDGAWSLADRKRGRQPIASNRSASIWEIGDDVACLELHSKMNTIDDFVLEMMTVASRLRERGFAALVVGNDARNFSVGVNLAYVVSLIEAKQWTVLEAFVRHGQTAMTALKMSPLPVVSAVAGHALGGGCEIALHSDAIQAHAETYMGLVETSVGIIPSWGGCRELLLRAQRHASGPKGPAETSKAVFGIIAGAAKSASALDAQKLGYLSASDGISMNRARLLADAKSKAIAFADRYQPPSPEQLILPGPPAAAALTMSLEQAIRSGAAQDRDLAVGTVLARVVTGGDGDVTRPCSESFVLDLECAGFMQAARLENTSDRMNSVLAGGK
jgi:3-hydroxyacyl-CoA dehydrogenase